MPVQKLSLNSSSSARHTLAILSGKGGVGKSFVTSSLAVALRRQGYRVGILDADITGPSIPKAFGLTEAALSDGKNMIPLETETGIKVMSINLILEDPSAAVLWRAPIVSNAIHQFYENVNWGDLDFLLVDMPPGTGDVALTVFQSLNISGIVLVTTPQDLVELIVDKSYNMARQMNLPILGLVENMSYFTCPHCGEQTDLYGPSKAASLAKKYGLEKTLRLPIDPNFSQKVDAGEVEEIQVPGMDTFVLGMD